MMRAAAVTEKASRVAPLAHWPKWPLLGQLLYRLFGNFVDVFGHGLNVGWEEKNTWQMQDEVSDIQKSKDLFA